MLPYEKEVAAGLDLLLRRDPDKIANIDPDTIDMGSDTMCVLGQAYGSTYMEAAEAIGLNTFPLRLAHGFTVSQISDIPSLGCEWGRQLRILAAKQIVFKTRISKRLLSHLLADKTRQEAAGPP